MPTDLMKCLFLPECPCRPKVPPVLPWTQALREGCRLHSLPTHSSRTAWRRVGRSASWEPETCSCPKAHTPEIGNP